MKTPLRCLLATLAVVATVPLWGQCEEGENTLVVQIVTDAYPSETTWQVSADGEVLLAGGWPWRQPLWINLSYLTVNRRQSGKGLPLGYIPIGQYWRNDIKLNNYFTSWHKYCLSEYLPVCLIAGQRGLCEL